MSNIEVNPIPNQAADKLPHIPESTLNQEDFSVLVNDNLISFNLSEEKLAVNQAAKWVKVSQIFD